MDTGRLSNHLRSLEENLLSQEKREGGSEREREGRGGGGGGRERERERERGERGSERALESTNLHGSGNHIG